MNGLTLRISGTGKNKMKATTTFNPVLIPENLALLLSSKHDMFKSFINSSAENQLKILRNLSYASFNKDDLRESDVMEFLAVVYLNAESKHPAQCCVIRYITKNETLHKPFTEALIELIKHALSKEHNTYVCYKDTVSQLCSCIDNLPGADAIKTLEAVLAEYLKDCLECCVIALRDKSLAPTDKNEIFSLVHSTFRILLFIVQKLSDKSQGKMDSIFKSIELSIMRVLHNEETPMDTKSVGGILYVTLYVMENGPDSWIDIVRPEKESKVQEILKNELARLSLLSAVSTVIPTNTLYSTMIDSECAMFTITKEILAVGERMSWDTVVLLGVSRAVAAAGGALRAAGVRGAALLALLLPFVWAHLEHPLDRVGHLCAQVLAHAVAYCAHLHSQGDGEPLDNLFSALALLDRGRKSFYLCVTALSRELGAQAVMERLPGVVEQTIGALNIQAVQASASNCLETLLQKHVREVRRQQLQVTWLEPLLQAAGCRRLEPAALGELQRLLVLAVTLDPPLVDYIMVHVREVCEDQQLTGEELKCALMLLSVARKCGALGGLAEGGLVEGERWKGVVSYQVLQRAAVEALEENRILSISLIVECPKSTEAFTERELQWVLWFLKNNCNAQAPSFRQTTLSLIKKFINRLDESYGALVRQQLPVEHYLEFLEQLRHQCFHHLLPGANYSRRHTALQTLLWTERALLRHPRIWKEEYVEKLLLHLEDSYENNKALALELLLKCPDDLLKKKYTTSLDFEDIISQASSVKPSECVSAAYKMELLLYKLPDHVPPAADCPRRHPVRWRAVRATLLRARAQLERLQLNLLHAARDAPLHGVLHVLRRLLQLQPGELSFLGVLSTYPQWKEVVEDIIAMCMEVNAAVASVVNSASPEGHLPMDTTRLSSLETSDGNVQLEDGRHVTAQMVLLCAWRSVKEVSLILGHIVADARCDAEVPGELPVQRVRQVGAHFTALLAQLKHRGAFEQAYVGFTTMLSSLWKHRVAELRALPGAWLEQLMDSIASGADPRLCATRRSAGLPFMIQALVTTELQSGGGRAFGSCVRRLLQLGRLAHAADTRVHCANIVRALFRCGALREQLAPHAPAALMLALHGFRAPSWSERNSSTLLFSALMVWTFGVQRSRDSENLCTRNRMTGRIFFLRFPELYDYMLNALEQARSDDTLLLSGALYPVLLLLARLYPSALEGTVSNFKVCSFVPLVRACGRSSVLHTRRLAARALVPLLTPHTYLPVMMDLLESVCDPGLPTNYCHGTLLQLTRLFDSRPEDLTVEPASRRRLTARLRDCGWVLRHTAGAAPCYLLADEFLKVLNCALWRFPTLLNSDLIQDIQNQLYDLIFVNEKQTYHPGFQLCLANATYLYLIISHVLEKTDQIRTFIHTCLAHDTYEVILSILNYILIVYEKLETENKFQEHLKVICENSNMKMKLEIGHEIFEDLCEILKTNKYLECQQKALQVLTIKEGTQKYIIKGKTTDDTELTELTDGAVVDKLIEFVENEHENFTHNYLQSLTNFAAKKISNSSIDDNKLLKVIRVVFACSSSDNSEDTRAVVVEFLETSFKSLLNYNLSNLKDDEKFEFKATLYSTLVVMLEDEVESLRQRSSNVTSAVLGGSSCTVPSRAGELLREHLGGAEDAVALLVLLALLDFRSAVRLTDEINDECRVFDQSEQHNAFFEETIWTRACVDTIKQISNKDLGEPAAFVRTLVRRPKYSAAFGALCGDHARTLAEGRSPHTDGNPKLQVFVDTFVH